MGGTHSEQDQDTLQTWDQQGLPLNEPLLEEYTRQKVTS